MCDTSSLNAMQKTALNEENFCCSKKINDYWLEVVYSPFFSVFQYYYNNKKITLEQTNELMKAE